MLLSIMITIFQFYISVACVTGDAGFKDYLSESSWISTSAQCKNINVNVNVIRKECAKEKKKQKTII